MNWLYGLDDPRDRWWADDKLAHFFGGWVAVCLTHSWWCAIAAGVLVEAVELYRWYGWKRRGFPQPWPEMTDRVSLKDLAWVIAGATLALA